MGKIGIGWLDKMGVFQSVMTFVRVTLLYTDILD